MGKNLTEEQLAGLVKTGNVKVHSDATSKRKPLTREDYIAAHLPIPPRVSKIEQRFLQQLEAAKAPPCKRNYFFMPGRDFELDFAWPGEQFAVEIQGMAHRIKVKFKRDIEKRALAQLAGWTVLELDGDAVRSEKGILWTMKLLDRLSLTTCELLAS